ncbi:hypothetical protein DV737_g5306, partial [Chaetothyriales sp. CBS 132003]
MVAIPEKTTVLVIGGGPGGSYAASALAREGQDVVLLEGDKFPRYHIGESMLASLRYFLRFIDLDSTFDNYGFTKKRGAAFKLNDKPEGFTDFIAAGGPNNYSWNVIRSEADYLMFQHAGKSGAKTFDEVRVTALEFEKSELKLPDPATPSPGRASAAHWTNKADGTSGTIKFDYLIDASGRFGILSTKYLKNRKFNSGLKNIADWAYWKNTGTYAPGTHREGQPFFEALQDTSGWCWYIPLHDGTVSVGIVQNQEMAKKKKQESGSLSDEEFYRASFKHVPQIEALVNVGERVSPVKHASDWSYSASCYASPNARIAGDAGCFIDPYFSSGVHLAISSGLSAAITIRAVQRGEVDETTAMNWHSKKTAEGYSRFLLVVLSAMKQIRRSNQPVLSDLDEEGFERAFAFFRPIIQGTADVTNAKLTQEELCNTIDFCLNAFKHNAPEDVETVMKKIAANKEGAEEQLQQGIDTTAKALLDSEGLTEQELQVVKGIMAKKMLQRGNLINVDSFGTDLVDGYAPRLKRGELGLRKPQDSASESVAPTADMFAGGMTQANKTPGAEQQAAVVEVRG